MGDKIKWLEIAGIIANLHKRGGKGVNSAHMCVVSLKAEIVLGPYTVRYATPTLYYIEQVT